MNGKSNAAEPWRIKRAKRAASSAADNPPKSSTAATAWETTDPDVAVARNYIDAWVMDGHAAARAALERIDRRLMVGNSLAAIVDDAIKAGHVKVVKP